MPGRFTITVDADTLKKRYNVDSIPDEYNPRYNASPGQMIPIILNKTRKAITLAKWGYTNDFIKHPMVNARSEDIEHNKVFSKAFRERRCILPMDSYYEWEETSDGKLPYRIMLKDKSIFSVAGVYIEHEDRIEFATITIEPNKLVGKIHERMPAIVRKEDEEKWLNSPDTALLKTYPDNEMMTYRVSKDMNSSKHDKKEYILPVKHEEHQSTL